MLAPEMSATMGRTNMGRVLLTLELGPREASLPRVKRSLELTDSEIDGDYGLVEVSPKRHLYTVLVSPDAALRVRRHEHVRRVSSNPTIAALEPGPIGPSRVNR
jgi:hypothetical protein